MGTSPVVIARAQGVTAQALSVNRPTWADMNKHYPNESIQSPSFFPMVGKDYVAAYKGNQDAYENTCAARMSFALNRSGMKLPVAPEGGSIKGDDKLNYWLRVKQLSARLNNQFGKPDKELKHRLVKKTTEVELYDERQKNALAFIGEIKSMKGIMVFEVTGWGNATGHFTLWDGKDLSYVGRDDYGNTPHNWPDLQNLEYYFWYIRGSPPDKVGSQMTRAYLWELK